MEFFDKCSDIVSKDAADKALPTKLIKLLEAHLKASPIGIAEVISEAFPLEESTKDD